MPSRLTISSTSTTPLAPRRRAPAPALRVGVPAREATDELGVNGVVAARFLARVDGEKLRHVLSRTFPRRDAMLGDLALLGAVELSWAVEEGQDVLLHLHDAGIPVLLVTARGSCEAVVAAHEAGVARDALAMLERALRDDPPPDGRVALRFWAAGPDGGEDQRRAVEAPEWAEIAGNYPAASRTAMDALVAATAPVGGSLVLWHGPPGTGKTHALQALARAWQPWCTTHFVTDPERLLQGKAYLMDVATRSLGDDRRPWRLIVLEDAGELMAAGARSDVGQGLSRVLNLTDGLLGQGLRCLMLVTTNEPLGRLHPAIRRPGRCWAEVEFGAFGAAEAAAWLALRDVAHEPGGPLTLAELYALRDGRELGGRAGGAPPFGFAR